jgi:hypothetical protein
MRALKKIHQTQRISPAVDFQSIVCVDATPSLPWRHSHAFAQALELNTTFKSAQLSPQQFNATHRRWVTLIETGL